jgi:polyisoprenoid-binding protein YceI
MRLSLKKRIGVRPVASLAVALHVVGGPTTGQLPREAPSRSLLLWVDPSASTVHFTLPTTLHTVHGEFALKRGSIHFDPATDKAEGEIAVDATSGESGNGSRDKRMHKEILESARYTEIVFRPDRVIGAVALSGSSNVQIHGMFNLHGADHEVTIPVAIEFSGNNWKGTASFDVPYIEWGLKNPSNFVLKVNRAAEVNLELSGRLGPTAK